MKIVQNDGNEQNAAELMQFSNGFRIPPCQKKADEKKCKQSIPLRII